MDGVNRPLDMKKHDAYILPPAYTNDERGDENKGSAAQTIRQSGEKLFFARQRHTSTVLAFIAGNAGKMIALSLCCCCCYTSPSDDNCVQKQINFKLCQRQQ